MVGGIQQLVARDGGSAERGGGGGDGTDRGAVRGSGGAKEVAQPGGDWQLEGWRRVVVERSLQLREWGCGVAETLPPPGGSLWTIKMVDPPAGGKVWSTGS